MLEWQAMLDPSKFGAGFGLTLVICLILSPALLDAPRPSHAAVVASGPLLLIGACIFAISGWFPDPSGAYGSGSALCLLSSCVLLAAGLSVLMRRHDP